MREGWSSQHNDLNMVILSAMFASLREIKDSNPRNFEETIWGVESK